MKTASRLGIHGNACTYCILSALWLLKDPYIISAPWPETWPGKHTYQQVLVRAETWGIPWYVSDKPGKVNLEEVINLLIEDPYGCVL